MWKPAGFHIAKLSKKSVIVKIGKLFVGFSLSALIHKNGIF